MTTENTTPETTPETIETLPPTPTQIAEEFVKESTTSMIVEEFVNHHNTIERQKQQLLTREQDISNWRTRYNSMSETIEEFLKEHIGDNDSASITDLKELAAELDIEMTKEIEVTFTVEVTATLTVPIGFDAEEISDNDFDIRVDYTGRHDDVSEEGIDWDVNDFDSDDK